jgi:hypothetical protein
MKFPNYTLGLFTGLCLGALYFMLPIIIEGFRTPTEKQVQALKSNFTVVDSFDGCEVIRWSENGIAEYKYFLDCRK